MDVKKWLPNIVTLALAALLVITQQVWAGPLVAQLTTATTASSKTTVNYQGYPTDSNGNPVNGTLNMVFRLYRNESDAVADAIWTETQTSVAVSDGLFSVLLGSVADIPTAIIANNDNLWLGVTVGADVEEMSPREKIASSPYAMLANVPDGSITQSKLASDAVNSAKIQDGQVGNADLANNAVTSAKIQDGQVSNVDLANNAVRSQHFKPTIQHIYRSDQQSTSSTSWQDIPGTFFTLSVDSNQKVMIWGQASMFQEGTDGFPWLRIVANGVEVAAASTNGGTTPGGVWSYESIPVMGVYSASPGSVEVKMQFRSGASYGTVYAINRNLFAMAVGR